MQASRSRHAMGRTATEYERGEPTETDVLLPTSSHRAGVPSQHDIDAIYAENTNIWQRKLVLIPVFYLLLGFCISFPFVAQRQYLRRTLHVNPSGQGAVLGVLIQFPWFIKLLFAFLSDSVPICGLRRKPYCAIGVVLCGAAWILLGVLPRTTPAVFCALSALATLGLVVADVMVDTLVVFIVREYEQLRTDKLGTLQTTTVSVACVRVWCCCSFVLICRGALCVNVVTCARLCTQWILRFCGSIVGMLAGGLLLEHAHFAYETIFALTGVIFLLCLIPPLFFFKEVVWRGGYDIRNQFETIWECVLHLHAMHHERRAPTLIYAC